MEGAAVAVEGSWLMAVNFGVNRRTMKLASDVPVHIPSGLRTFPLNLYTKPIHVHVFPARLMNRFQEACVRSCWNRIVISTLAPSRVPNGTSSIALQAAFVCCFLNSSFAQVNPTVPADVSYVPASTLIPPIIPRP